MYWDVVQARNGKNAITQNMDEITTIKQLIAWCRKVRKDRGWNPNAKSIAISLALEAAELLEHFQWEEARTVKQKVKKDTTKREEIQMEVAEIMYYLCEFADKLDIDIADSLKKKIQKIEEKYPTDKIRKYGDAFYYSQKKAYRKNK